MNLTGHYWVCSDNYRNPNPCACPDGYLMKNFSEVVSDHQRFPACEEGGVVSVISGERE